jgi:hypothetical protein
MAKGLPQGIVLPASPQRSDLSVPRAITDQNAVRIHSLNHKEEAAMTRWEVRRQGRQVKKIRSNVGFGAPKKRVQTLQDGILKLETIEQHLEEEKQTLCQLFREEQEKWTGNVAENTHLRPVAEP